MAIDSSGLSDQPAGIASEGMAEPARTGGWVRPRAEITARPAARDRMRRILYGLALPAFQAYQLVMRPRVRSVACLITHEGEVLLVRHTYRDQERWTLPGGLRRSDESAADAAGREMEEELGRRLTGWRTVRSTRHRSRTGLHVTTCLHAEVDSRSVDPDAGELARTAWFPVGELPQAISSDAVRMLGLLR